MHLPSRKRKNSLDGHVVGDTRGPVPTFGPRTVCTGCGMIGADARPNWRERYDACPITRGH
jgi:hypothetical protein